MCPYCVFLAEALKLCYKSMGSCGGCGDGVAIPRVIRVIDLVFLLLFQWGGWVELAIAFFVVIFVQQHVLWLTLR